MSKHNLVEYGLAKEAFKDLPLIKIELDNCAKSLYKYRSYLATQYVIDAIIESRNLINRQYKAAQKIVESKGRE